MASRLSFVQQTRQIPGQSSQPRAESANINRRSTVVQQHLHPQTNVRGESVRQSAWLHNARGKERQDSQNSTMSMQTDIVEFLRSKGKVLKSGQWSTMNDYVECFLFFHEIGGLKLIAKNHLTTIQGFNVNQPLGSNQQNKQSVATIRSNVVQLIGAIWYILANPPYDNMSAQLRSFLHSFNVNKVANPFERQTDILKGINSDLAAIQTALDSGSRKALAPKLIASLTRDSWRMLLLIQYLEFIKKSYHKFVSEHIQIRKTIEFDKNNNATVVLAEIIADLTPEQRKALQDVEGLYPINDEFSSNMDRDGKDRGEEKTIILGANDDGTFDDDTVKNMIDHAFQMFPDKNLVVTPPYSGMILSLYTRTSPCETNETLEAFQQKVNDCRVAYMDRLDAISHENAQLKSQLRGSLEVLCSNMAELLMFISHNNISDQHINTQMFNFLKKAKLIATDEIIRIEKIDPSQRDAALIGMFKELKVTDQYMDLVIQSIIARSQDFYTMYNACTDSIDAFFTLLTQRVEALEGALNLLNNQNKKEILSQKVANLLRQKAEVQEKIDGISDQLSQIQEKKLLNATDYVSYHIYSLHVGQLETIDQGNKKKSAQIIELQEKILVSKSLLSQSANGLIMELSALQDKVAESPTLAKFMETSGVYSAEKIQNFVSAFMNFSDSSSADITIPLDKSGTINAIEQMCSTMSVNQTGEPRKFADICAGLRMTCDKLTHLLNIGQGEIARKQQEMEREHYTVHAEIDRLDTENKRWKDQCSIVAMRYSNFKVARDYEQDVKNERAMAVLEQIHDLSKKKVDLGLKITNLDHELAELTKKREAVTQDLINTQAECNEKVRRTVLSCNNVLAMVESFRIRTTDALSNVAASLQQTGERVDEAEYRIREILDLVKKMSGMAAAMTEKHRK